MKTIEDYKRELLNFSKKNSTQSVPFANRHIDNPKTAVSAVAEQNSATTNNSFTLSGKGTLVVSLTHSKGLFPIAGGSVCVEDAAGKSFYCKQTDQSGKTTEWVLPAPPKELSETPNVLPKDVSALYTVKINAEGYLPVIIEGVPIFDGVKTLQPLDMLLASAAPSGTPEIIKFSNSYTL